MNSISTRLGCWQTCSRCVLWHNLSISVRQLHKGRLITRSAKQTNSGFRTDTFTATAAGPTHVFTASVSHCPMSSNGKMCLRVCVCSTYGLRLWREADQWSIASKPIGRHAWVRRGPELFFTGGYASTRSACPCHLCSYKWLSVADATKYSPSPWKLQPEVHAVGQE